jgi:hypothetical protein
VARHQPDDPPRGLRLVLAERLDAGVVAFWRRRDFLDMRAQIDEQRLRAHE